MNQTSVMTQPVDLRELAREWIAETITKHLAPELAGGDRIKQVSAAFEEEARERNLPIELAVGMAVEWCENQNEEAGLAHFGR